MLNDEQKADYAKLILENPLFEGACKAIEEDIVDKLKRIGIGDTEAQKDLVITLQLLGQLKRRLKTHVETGQLIEMQRSKPKILGGRKI